MAHIRAEKKLEFHFHTQPQKGSGRLCNARNEGLTFSDLRTMISQFAALGFSGSPLVVSIVGEIVRWFLVAFLGSQAVIFIALMLSSVWNGAIKPRLIPAGDIGRVADGIIAGYADPEDEAFARHQAVWYRTDGAEIAYWHRVRKAVRRRLHEIKGLWCRLGDSNT